MDGSQAPTAGELVSEAGLGTDVAPDPMSAGVTQRLSAQSALVDRMCSTTPLTARLPVAQNSGLKVGVPTRFPDRTSDADKEDVGEVIGEDLLLPLRERMALPLEVTKFLLGRRGMVDDMCNRQVLVADTVEGREERVLEKSSVGTPTRSGRSVVGVQNSRLVALVESRT